MGNNHNDIIEYEDNIKPNTRVAFDMLIFAVLLIFIWICNESGLFYVNKSIMRISTVSGVILLVLPQILTINPKIQKHPITKYVFIVLLSIAVYFLCICLHFHAILIALFPVLLSMFYNSKRLVIISSIICAFILITYPIFSILLGTWSYTFFEFLATVNNNTIEYTDIASKYTIIDVIKYISFPNIVILAAFTLVALSVSKKGSENTKNLVKIALSNELDSLTNLYNQNYYHEFIKQDFKFENIGIIFFDINLMKQTNDTYGHIYGDILLTSCSDSIRSILDDKSIAFRVGGDEFVALFDVDSEKELLKKYYLWEKKVAEINSDNSNKGMPFTCDISAGYSFGKSSDFKELVKIADERMYEEKKAYHKSLSK